MMLPSYSSILGQSEKVECEHLDDSWCTKEKKWCCNVTACRVKDPRAYAEHIRKKAAKTRAKNKKQAQNKARSKSNAGRIV